MRSFAEVVSSDEDEDGNIFNQGNLLLRNEESEFVQEDVNSLDADLKSQSESSDEPGRRPAQTPVDPRPAQSQQSRYSELIMASPDQRQAPYMQVYSQDDDEEVELNPRQRYISNRLSGRHSGVSEEDFYGGPQFT